MTSDQAAFELGCNKKEHWGCRHRSPAEYARQINWNRRYLKPGDGDRLSLLREIRDSRPDTPLHLHEVTPLNCTLCVPHFPLNYSDGPGLYARFKKACERSLA